MRQIISRSCAGRGRGDGSPDGRAYLILGADVLEMEFNDAFARSNDLAGLADVAAGFIRRRIIQSHAAEIMLTANNRRKKKTAAMEIAAES